MQRSAICLTNPDYSGATMKTAGLIGGMSWESTATYYRLMNEGVKQALGGLHSAKLILHSVDFAEVEQLLRHGDWRTAGLVLEQAAWNLEQAGADFLMICTNTMHRVADAITARVSIPLLHIVDATAEEIVAAGHRNVALLGTRFTMEQEFYRQPLEEQYGLAVVIPEKADRDVINSLIFEELCLGIVSDESRHHFIRIVQQFENKGLEAIILGCTEIAMALDVNDVNSSLYDTTRIHAAKAVVEMVN